jgi:3'-phosphoadenosine 5'-phosphosulfate sulfotransferase (PAPS reductase)/FAD synthetase
MRHIIPISGKDSAWTAVIQKQRQPELPYEYIFNSTGTETPEVFDWLSTVEQRLHISITRIGADLTEIIYDQGMLPSIKARYCTRMAKIYPMEDWLGDDPALLYLGIRADENRVGYTQRGRRNNITPVYPLREAQQTLAHVWQGVHDYGIAPPQFHWIWLYNEVCSLLGEQAHLVQELPSPLYQQLFAWRSRANCYYCFYQRTYEWVGLLEHHPDLFWRSVEMEEQIGAQDYTWRQGESLRELAARASEVKQKRAKKVADFIVQRTQQHLFEEDKPDMLHVVSCGLLCGK